MDVPCQINPYTLKGTLFNCYSPAGEFGVLSLSNSSYQPAYGTQPGWDFATGLGSVNAANLVNNWLSSVPFQLSAISPESVAVGTGVTSISVGGSGFSSKSQVQFNANGTQTALATTFISQSQLSASIPARLLQTAGTAQVSVQIRRARAQAPQRLLPLRWLRRWSARSRPAAHWREALHSRSRSLDRISFRAQFSISTAWLNPRRSSAPHR